MTTLEHLPQPIVNLIPFLDLPTLVALMRVNHFFYQLLMTDRVWKPYVEVYFDRIHWTHPNVQNLIVQATLEKKIYPHLLRQSCGATQTAKIIRPCCTLITRLKDGSRVGPHTCQRCGQIYCHHHSCSCDCFQCSVAVKGTVGELCGTCFGRYYFEDDLLADEDIRFCYDPLMSNCDSCETNFCGKASCKPFQCLSCHGCWCQDCETTFHRQHFECTSCKEIWCSLESEQELFCDSCANFTCPDCEHLFHCTRCMELTCGSCLGEYNFKLHCAQCLDDIQWCNSSS